MLFDVDGTLCDSDPLHFATFQEFLAERGFNGGAKIDEAFFREKIAGRHNPDIFRELFPQLSAAEQADFIRLMGKVIAGLKSEGD